MPSTRENRAYCRAIANDLEAYAHGEIARCSKCGYEGTRIEFEQLAFEGDYHCTSCHTDLDGWDLETATVSDYFFDVLGVEYQVDAYDNYMGVSLTVATGPPSVYVSTPNKAVQLFWNGSYESYPITQATSDAIDEYYEQHFEDER